MREYLWLRFKKISTLFIIPIIVEFLFYLYTVINHQEATVSEFHGLWYAAAAAVVCFVTVYSLLQDYYVGHDSLWKVLPYSKELLTLIDIIYYIIGTVIFGMIYQIVQNHAMKMSFNVGKYMGIKSLSLLSFYLLIFAICCLFKNVLHPMVGRTLIIVLLGVIIGLQISYFWKINTSAINHFFMGMTNEISLKQLVYINVLPYLFFNATDAQLSQLANSSLLFNSVDSLISLGFIFLSTKIRKLNYIDLVG